MMKRNRSGQTGALRTEARTGATLCLDLRHKYDSYITCNGAGRSPQACFRSQANHYLPRIQQEKIEGYDV